MALAELTLVATSWRKKRRNHRLLFGHPVGAARLDWQRSVAAFAPGAVFAYERWQAEKFGTTSWRIGVFRAAAPGDPIGSMRGIRPGAERLVSIEGAERCRAFLKLIDEIKALRDPARIPPLDWQLIGARFEAGFSVEGLVERVLERCA